MGPFYYYGIDPLYIYLMIPALIVTAFAQIKVKTTFSKYSREFAGLTGAEAAQRVLDQNGVSGVRIERVNGNLTDHYDPKSNVIRLSDSVYSANTVAAVGVAAHEAGHAVQYAHNYSLINLRTAIIPVCSIGSKLTMPLILLGLLFNFAFLIDLGIIFYSLALIFQLLTLPVEFNASNRALKAINEGFLLEGESYKGAKKVLTAAALTYVAALLVSLAQLARFIAISNRRR